MRSQLVDNVHYYDLCSSIGTHGRADASGVSPWPYHSGKSSHVSQNEGAIPLLADGAVRFRRITPPWPLDTEPTIGSGYLEIIQHPLWYLALRRAQGTGHSRIRDVRRAKNLSGPQCRVRTRRAPAPCQRPSPQARGRGAPGRRERGGKRTGGTRPTIEPRDGVPRLKPDWLPGCRRSARKRSAAC